MKSRWLIFWGLRIYLVLIFGYILYDAARRRDPLALVPPVVIFALISPPIIKSSVLSQITDNIRSVIVTPEALPLLDRATVDALTTELIGLGFTQLGDYTVENPAVKSISVFARRFQHFGHSGHGEIQQYFMGSRALPVTTIFISFFNDGPIGSTLKSDLRPPLPLPGAPDHETVPEEPCWSYTTYNRKRSTLSQLLYSPRALSRRMANVGASEMWHRHLTEREVISKRLKLPIVREFTLDEYFAWVRASRRLLSYRMRRTNFYFALPRAYFNNSDEWWGELGQIEPSS